MHDDDNRTPNEVMDQARARLRGPGVELELPAQTIQGEDIVWDSEDGGPYWMVLNLTAHDAQVISSALGLLWRSAHVDLKDDVFEVAQHFQVGLTAQHVDEFRSCAMEPISP